MNNSCLIKKRVIASALIALSSFETVAGGCTWINTGSGSGEDFLRCENDASWQTAKDQCRV
jgi:hypothetical protein